MSVRTRVVFSGSPTRTGTGRCSSQFSRGTGAIDLEAPEVVLPVGVVVLRELVKGHHLGDGPCFSRADLSPQERRDFFVFIDEFQSFTTLALANMLSEMRKYLVGFTVAHQYLHQLEPDIRHAVLGNAGTLISFRVGAEDAPFLVREFEERFEQSDLLRLENYHIYLKLMIDGMPSSHLARSPWDRIGCHSDQHLGPETKRGAADC
jgi:hypothetical protein